MQVYPVLPIVVQRACKERVNDTLCFREVSGYGSSRTKPCLLDHAVSATHKEQLAGQPASLFRG